MGDVVARLQSVSNASPVAVCALIRHSNLIRDEAFSLAGGFILAAVEEESGRGGRRGQF